VEIQLVTSDRVERLRRYCRQVAAKLEATRVNTSNRVARGPN